LIGWLVANIGLSVVGELALLRGHGELVPAATLGKLALGIVVTDLSGGRISFARASGRHAARFLSTAVC
jgi:uncharacterized RDD family membrane protein YckC